MLDLGMPEWQVTALLELQEYYITGKCGAVTDVSPECCWCPSITLTQS